MSTITKERIEQFANDPMMCVSDEVRELARIALASQGSKKIILYRERNPYNGLTTGWEELTEQEYEIVKDNASKNAEFQTVYTARPVPVVPAELHPDTQKLVTDFCTALAEKLYKAQLKYGYDADWKQDGWPTQCQAHFHQHIAKGDPRDVAAYCAFMWYHGWKTEPAPVSVPDELTREEYKRRFMEDDDFDDTFLGGWSACRDAMLQGVENAETPTTMQTAPDLDSSPKIAESPTGINQGKSEPVTTANKLPANVIDALEKALEAMSFMGDTLNAMDAVCEEDVEYVTPAFEAVRSALNGNSPVIQDGWVMLPAEPTQAMMNAWLSEVANWRGHAAGYRAMIAAAPQQEVTEKPKK